MFYPLHVFVCEKCFLVQLEEFESPENIFSDYLYFSSYSDSWLKHCEGTRHLSPTIRIGRAEFCREVASNDGYLLQYFVKKGCRFGD